MPTNLEVVSRSEPSVVLPDQLAAIVTPQRLAQNEADLLASVPEVDQGALDRARKALLSLHLIHGSKSETGFERGLLSYARVVELDADETVGMTFPFDKDLGLDHCVFFSWPLPSHPGDYKGANRILLSSSLLIDKRCFVTPRDIYEVLAYNQDEHGNHFGDERLSDEEWTQVEGVYEEVYSGTYQQLENGPTRAFEYDGVHIPISVAKAIKARIRQQFHNLYFTKVVSGLVWLEYIAHLLAIHGLKDLPLGEIKFTGVVPPSEMVASITDKEFEEVYIPRVTRVLAEFTTTGS